MADETNLLHATGHHGRTLVESLDVVAERVPVLDRRRLA
jgi:predicted nucleotidyltransferase